MNWRRERRLLRETLSASHDGTYPVMAKETISLEAEDESATEEEPQEEMTADPHKELVDVLSPVFRHSHCKAREFVERIDGMKPSKITQEVCTCLRRGEVDEELCHRPLWKILHDRGLYSPSESNWNKRIL